MFIVTKNSSVSFVISFLITQSILNLFKPKLFYSLAPSSAFIRELQKDSLSWSQSDLVQGDWRSFLQVFVSGKRHICRLWQRYFFCGDKYQFVKQQTNIIDVDTVEYNWIKFIPVGANVSLSVSGAAPQFTAVMYLSLWSHTRRNERDEAEE